MDNLKLIFCYECNPISKSDERYIFHIIKRFYNIFNKISITHLYLSGRSNYCSKSVISRIEKEKKHLYHADSNSNIKIIYFIDSDEDMNRLSSRNKNEIENIQKFCCENNYGLVISVKEIEDIIGIKEKGNKHKICLNFLKCPNKPDINEAKLKLEFPMIKGESNILFILDKYILEYRK